MTAAEAQRLQAKAINATAAKSKPTHLKITVPILGALVRTGIGAVVFGRIVCTLFPQAVSQFACVILGQGNVVKVQLRK